jgi:hypothetical protein
MYSLHSPSECDYDGVGVLEIDLFDEEDLDDRVEQEFRPGCDFMEEVQDSMQWRLR